MCSNGNFAKNQHNTSLLFKNLYMKSLKKSTDSANLCSMSFLKVLKSKIKRADNAPTFKHSEQGMRGLEAFNSRFRVATS